MKLICIRKYLLLGATLALWFTPKASIASNTFPESKLANATSGECVPSLQASVSSSTDPFPVADSFFKKGQFTLAARAYYQTFLCDGVPIFEGVNPAVYEANMVKPLGVAIKLAANGQFGAAATQCNELKNALPPFTEAGYLSGVFAWASGDRVEARKRWADTLKGRSFATPDESNGDPGQTAARLMLNWSTGER